MLYVLKSKEDCSEIFKGLVEMQLEHKIKTFWLDNGWNIISKAFNNLLKNHDIKKQTFTM